MAEEPKKERMTLKSIESDDKPKPLSPAHVAAIAEVKAKQVATNLTKKQVGGFTNFIREQGVVGVGIGLVLGVQVKAVVDTIMASFVNPLTTLLLPGQSVLSSQSFTLHIGSQTTKIGWGAIVYSIFTFLMVAIIIYAAYKMLKLDKLAKKKD